MCVLVEVTPCVTESQQGGKESTETPKSPRSVTPVCVWTMHSNTIFTFYSTFLKHSKDREREREKVPFENNYEGFSLPIMSSSLLRTSEFWDWS